MAERASLRARLTLADVVLRLPPGHVAVVPQLTGEERKFSSDRVGVAQVTLTIIILVFTSMV